MLKASGLCHSPFRCKEFPQSFLLSLFVLPDERNVNSFLHCRQFLITVLCLPFFWHSREQWTRFRPSFPRLLGTNSLLHVGQTFTRDIFVDFCCFNIHDLLRPDLLVGGILLQLMFSCQGKRVHVGATFMVSAGDRASERYLNRSAISSSPTELHSKQKISAGLFSLRVRTYGQYLEH